MRRHDLFRVLLFLLFVFSQNLSTGQSLNREIWFAPLPIMPTDEGRPFLGSLDFMELFEGDAPWPEAGKKLDVFKFYGEWVAYWATDEELKKAVTELNRRNIRIAVEEGPLNPTDSCGQDTEGFAGTEEGLKVANRIKNAGGTMHYLALDEPFFFASIDDNPHSCYWGPEIIAAKVDDYINEIRTVFPDVIVGDIEPLTIEIDIEEFKRWIDAFYSTNGYHLAFFHLDLSFDRPAWQDAVKELQLFTQSRGIDFGVIYMGDYFDESDADWIEKAEQRMAVYETEVRGNPDHVIFQSWVDKPDYCLPETDPYTFTHLINLYGRPRSVLTVTPVDIIANGFREVEVILSDTGNNPVPNEEVSLSLQTLYHPTVLEKNIILSDTIKTGIDGTFLYQFNDTLPFNISMHAHFPGYETNTSGDKGLWPSYARAWKGEGSGNLARGATVTASAHIDGDPPGNVNDGYIETSWNSGDDAPQWIELELEEPALLWQIRMAVAQYPEGETEHVVWAKVGEKGAEYIKIAELKGFTSDPQVLEFRSSSPMENIANIKIETLKSPSWVAWREIEIIPWDTVRPTFTYIEPAAGPVARETIASRSYPNPFSTFTWIEFILQKPEKINLIIYNQMGQVVRVIYNEVLPVGLHRVRWKGLNGAGQLLPSGCYFYRLASPGYQVSRPLLFLREYHP